MIVRVFWFIAGDNCIMRMCVSCFSASTVIYMEATFFNFNSMRRLCVNQSQRGHLVRFLFRNSYYVYECKGLWSTTPSSECHQLRVLISCLCVQLYGFRVHRRSPPAPLPLHNPLRAAREAARAKR